MRPIWVAIAVLVVLLNACGPYSQPYETPNNEPPAIGCPADLRPVITPNEAEEATIQPGETLQVTYKLLTCAGTEEIDVTPVWKSSNTSVAKVDNAGLVTALEVGTTDISVVEAEYGTGAVIEVNVVDLIP